MINFPGSLIATSIILDCETTLWIIKIISVWYLLRLSQIFNFFFQIHADLFFSASLKNVFGPVTCFDQRNMHRIYVSLPSRRSKSLMMLEARVKTQLLSVWHPDIGNHAHPYKACSKSEKYNSLILFITT